MRGGASNLYFGDEPWNARYLIAKAGGPISNRKVLISPNFVGEVDGHSILLFTDLTKEQVENSPGIEADRPVAQR